MALTSATVTNWTVGAVGMIVAQVVIFMTFPAIVLAGSFITTASFAQNHFDLQVENAL